MEDEWLAGWLAGWLDELTDGRMDSKKWNQKTRGEEEEETHVRHFVETLPHLADYVSGTKFIRRISR